MIRLQHTMPLKAAGSSSTSTHKHGSAVDLNVPFKKVPRNILILKTRRSQSRWVWVLTVLDLVRMCYTWIHDATKSGGSMDEGSEKFKFGGKGLQSIVPIQSYAFRKLVYGPSIPDDRITPLDRAVAQLTGKRRIREMKKNDLDKLIAEFLNENTGQGYGQYPYHSDSHDEDEPAEDYMEEWKALELELVRDETRNTAIAVAKILVKDLNFLTTF